MEENKFLKEMIRTYYVPKLEKIRKNLERLYDEVISKDVDKIYLKEEYNLSINELREDFINAMMGDSDE